MGGVRLDMILDIAGALWIVAVVVVFLGGVFGLPGGSVVVLEKVYALFLIAGVGWLARRTASASNAVRGTTGRD